MIDLSLILLIAVAVLAMALMVMWKKQAELRHTIELNEERLLRYQQEITALYTGAAGVGSHIARLENQISTLTDRQEQIDVRDPATQNYSLAIELAQQGAGAADLVRKCGLLHEEAELLVRLHGPQPHR